MTVSIRVDKPDYVPTSDILEGIWILSGGAWHKVANNLNFAGTKAGASTRPTSFSNIGYQGPGSPPIYGYWWTNWVNGGGGFMRANENVKRHFYQQFAMDLPITQLKFFISYKLINGNNMLGGSSVIRFGSLVKSRGRDSDPYQVEYTAEEAIFNGTWITKNEGASVIQLDTSGGGSDITQLYLKEVTVRTPDNKTYPIALEVPSRSTQTLTISDKEPYGDVTKLKDGHIWYQPLTSSAEAIPIFAEFEDPSKIHVVPDLVYPSKDVIPAAWIFSGGVWSKLWDEHSTNLSPNRFVNTSMPIGLNPGIYSYWWSLWMNGGGGVVRAEYNAKRHYHDNLVLGLPVDQMSFDIDFNLLGHNYYAILNFGSLTQRRDRAPGQPSLYYKKQSATITQTVQAGTALNYETTGGAAELDRVNIVGVRVLTPDGKKYNINLRKPLAQNNKAQTVSTSGPSGTDVADGHIWYQVTDTNVVHVKGDFVGCRNVWVLNEAGTAWLPCYPTALNNKFLVQVLSRVDRECYFYINLRTGEVTCNTDGHWQAYYKSLKTDDSFKEGGFSQPSWKGVFPELKLGNIKSYKRLEASVVHQGGRPWIDIRQQPTIDNDYTLMVYQDDWNGRHPDQNDVLFSVYITAE